MKKKVLFFPVFLIFPFLLLGACAGNNVKVTVQNPGEDDRLEAIVEIPVEDLQNRITLGDRETYIVKNAAGEVVTSQVTYDGKLIFQPGVAAGKSAGFRVMAGPRQQFEPSVYGRHVPERLDDYAWENERVAFRIYGAALLPVDGPSNGIDLWYKRTPEMIVDKWYRDDIAGVASYHRDNGQGLDDYKVGRTLGAGAMAPLVDGRLWLNENFVAHETLDNGPLRTTFKLIYKDIEVGGVVFSESRVFSLDAGAQFTRVEQHYGAMRPMQVAAGIVLRDGGASINGDDYIIYAEPHSTLVDDVYVAVIMPGMEDQMVLTQDFVGKGGVIAPATHYLAVGQYAPGQPAVYYVGYGWSKYGFPTVADFAACVDRFSRSLARPLVVTY